jgi:hypothetical protein
MQGRLRELVREGAVPASLALLVGIATGFFADDLPGRIWELLPVGVAVFVAGVGGWPWWSGPAAIYGTAAFLILEKHYGRLVDSHTASSTAYAVGLAAATFLAGARAAGRGRDTVDHSLGTSVVAARAGDAELFRQALRSTDVVMPQPSGEVWLRLPGTTLEGARSAAERLRLTLGLRPAPAFGVASCPPGAGVNGEALTAARLALQRALQLGGNRTVLSAPLAGAPRGWALPVGLADGGFESGGAVHDARRG